MSKPVGKPVGKPLGKPVGKPLGKPVGTQKIHQEIICKSWAFVNETTGCPTKHDSWWIIKTVFFHN